MAGALDAFWARGFDATSLDRLAEATGVARPSLAAAFGDKRALYLRVVDAFIDELAGAASALMPGKAPLAVELKAFYEAGLSLYLKGGDAPLGCLIVCTMPVEAAADEIIRARLRAILEAIDATFARRFALAAKAGEIPATRDTMAAGRLAAAVLHSLAVRARAGVGKAALRRLVADGIEMLCRT